MALFTRSAGLRLLLCNKFEPKRKIMHRLFVTRIQPTLYRRFRCFERCTLKGVRRASSVENGTRSCTSFDTMMEQRRDQAQRSVLVQVHSGLSYQDLKEHCSQFGAVESTLYYTTHDDLHFILLEFTAKEDAMKLLETTSYGSKIPAVPVSSPFIWLKATDRSARQQKSKESPPEAVSDSETSPQVLKELLQQADSVSQQMEILHNSTCLTDLGSRLRFLTARQLEMALAGMFPHVRALPFGSSVNGFGRAGCDLDLVLQLGGLEEGQRENRPLKENSRLVFHTKGSSACNGRAQLQRHMEALADMLHLFLPGCNRVVRILQARVPIIKFRHDLTMVECDLSMTNMTAVHMSELLFLLGEADPRVRPLVFCVRRWAQSVGLTNPTPGRWVSNFSLTLLTLFFLQTRQVLPSLNTLIHLAGDKDGRITADGVNCTFLRNLSNLAESKNEETLEELLRGFFEYFASYDFGGRGISLVTGKPMLKSDHSPLYLENPLERSLNVSKNVSPEETLRLQIELRNAAWLMEQQEDEEINPNQVWGLVSLLSDPRTSGLGPPKPRSHRLVHVKDLFSKDEAFVQTPKSHKSIRQRRR